MYKLCLIQSPFSGSWDWTLQAIEPHDWPFDPDRAEHYGIQKNLRDAIRAAHQLVPRSRVSYVFMDRRHA